MCNLKNGHAQYKLMFIYNEGYLLTLDIKSIIYEGDPEQNTYQSSVW